MDKIKECDVFNGLCGSYKPGYPFNCIVYGFIGPKKAVEEKIKNCLHRQEMNSDAGKTAVETAILNYFRSKK